MIAQSTHGSACHHTLHNSILQRLIFLCSTDEGFFPELELFWLLLSVLWLESMQQGSKMAGQFYW